MVFWKRKRKKMEELVMIFFGKKQEKKDGRTCYIIHDLLHELARKVSSFECLSIESYQSQVSSLKLLPSIRHLSINIDDTNVKDRLTLKNCVEDFNTLDTRLKVEKLRNLMIFGKHHGCFLNVFGDLFRGAKALRVIFLSEASYDVEYLLCNFYNLLHLRYLRIDSSYPYKVSGFPNEISRFYHMMVLDAKSSYILDLRDLNKLVKLRHFLVQNDATHSSIAEVGKLKSIQELRSFWVKKEGQGFELREIGHLTDLCGSLSIYNLEKVQVKEEAEAAKLLSKGRLHGLILHWGYADRSTNDSTLEEHVLERLQPTNNLLNLSIIGHRGTACPLWLGKKLSVKNLESLCLQHVAWETFPPIGELWLVSEPRSKTISRNIPNKRFQNLKRLQLYCLTMVERWDVHAPCQLFPLLEVLYIHNCPELVELSFSHSATCCQQGKESNENLFPRLSELSIKECPQLLSSPPVPWTQAPCTIWIILSSCLDRLICTERSDSAWRLEIVDNNGNHNYGGNVLSSKVRNFTTTNSTWWNVLAFHNLTRVKELDMHKCQSLPLRCLQILSSLRTLKMSCSSHVFPFVEADNLVKYQFSVESLTIIEWNASGKELTQLLTYFPELSFLDLWRCRKVTGLGVNLRGQPAMETPINLLLLPLQLQELRIRDCLELSLHSNSNSNSNPHNESNEDGPTGEGGIQGLSSLRKLTTWGCPKLLSTCSFSSFPFPNSLESISIYGAVGTEHTVVLLSNLTSLTRLSLWGCWDLRGKGLVSLLSQGHLTELHVTGTPSFFFDSEPSQSQAHEQEIPSHSSKLQELKIDGVARFTAASVHRGLLFSSLATLQICEDYNLDRFTEEQEDLLLVDSLEEISFWECRNLQYLPARLYNLPNLKKLRIQDCKAIQMLPKDALPSSLQLLVISNCPEIRTMPKVCYPSSLQKLYITRYAAIQMLPKYALPSSLQELCIHSCPEIRSLCLPSSLQRLEIRSCPAIKSLPKVDNLPSSLRELVMLCGSEELKKHCHKLIGIIPIVKT